MLDGLADGVEKLQPFVDREFLRCSIRRWNALDELHHKVRPAAIGDSGVEYAGDVGVIHHGQGLRFGLEAGQHLFGVHSRFDDLDATLRRTGFVDSAM